MSFIAGRVRPDRNKLRAMWDVLRGGVRTKEDCKKFLTSKPKGDLVRLTKSCHILVAAPTSAGKGVSCILPFLFSETSSCVIFDPKGENCKLTIEHRKRMGHECYVLDPYGITGLPSARFNALEFLDRESLTAIDDCRDIAKALVVREEGEKDRHFNDAAEMFIATIATATVQLAADGYKSLQTVREMLSNPAKMESAIAAAKESKAWDGMLSRLGHQLGHFQGNEAASVKTTVNRHMAWMDTPVMAESTKASDFNPSDLTKKKMTIYLVLPPERIKAQMGWLRMNIGSMMRAVMKKGVKIKSVVHFVIDEANSLGSGMDAISDALAIGRGYGIRLQLYYQDCGQIKKCWPNGQDQNVLANCTKVFFGISDVETAAMCEKMLGDSTILVEDWNTSYGGSHSESHGQNHSQTSGSSWNRSSSVKQIGRKVLKLEEIMCLPRDKALVFVPGLKGILVTRIKYYEEAWLTSKPGWFATQRDTLSTFLRSLLFLAWTSLMAFSITAIAMEFRTVERLYYLFHSLKGGVR